MLRVAFIAQNFIGFQRSTDIYLFIQQSLNPVPCITFVKILKFIVTQFAYAY